MSLKVDLKSKEERRVKFDYGWIWAIIAVLIAFVVFYSIDMKYEAQIEQRKEALQKLNNELAQYQTLEAQLEMFQGDINSIKEQITKLRELRYDPLRYSVLLVRLSKLLPSNVWFNTLSIDPAGSKVTLSGNSIEQPGHPPLASIAELILNLQQDKNNYFSGVALQSTSSSGKTGDIWQFSLQMNYNVPLINASASRDLPVVALRLFTPAARKVNIRQGGGI